MVTATLRAIPVPGLRLLILDWPRRKTNCTKNVINYHNTEELEQLAIHLTFDTYDCLGKQRSCPEEKGKSFGKNELYASL